jgi:crotonobetainyl-CoA:carnitine CoA-transferase CaiB-like acyl-CoA transferase
VLVKGCQLSGSLPLSGLVVVELGTSVAAPTAAQIFAELGAEVFKVENPAGGDDARSWGPPFVDGVGAIFVAINRNKRSVAIDFKDRDQCEALRRFILARADVVLQNLRAGVVERFGLGAEALTADKPALIYCNLSAFGDQGPRAGKPGYDPLMQAFGGLMSVTGEDGRPPVRVAPAIIDQGSAMWMVIGVLSALHRRAATGKGGVISTSLYETALFWMGVPTANFLAGKEVPRRLGTENGSLAPYKAYEAEDGWVVICAGNDTQFARLSAALGHPEWADDPDFRSNADRVRNRTRINALVAGVVETAAREHWQAVLDAAGVPCAPMLDLGEVLAHPQSHALGMLQNAPDGGIPLMGVPLRFDGERPPFRASAPKLGEATGVVLGGVRGKAAE